MPETEETSCGGAQPATKTEQSLVTQDNPDDVEIAGEPEPVPGQYKNTSG